jgi:hypothetical protein
MSHTSWRNTEVTHDLDLSGGGGEYGFQLQNASAQVMLQPFQTEQANVLFADKRCGNYMNYGTLQVHEVDGGPHAAILSRS